MIDTVRIPEQRKGALIGREGCVKSELERKTRTAIKINDGVEIKGEVLDVLKAKEIVKAIGRGFPPEKAFKLMHDDFRLVVISLGDENEKRMKRLLSRIIGKSGKCRRTIEMLTKTDICIYGKTIAIIGGWENVEKANEAIGLLLKGKTHAYVYRCLESGKGDEE
jgi:ribosomal RNA assembly protein